MVGVYLPSGLGRGQGMMRSRSARGGLCSPGGKEPTITRIFTLAKVWGFHENKSPASTGWESLLPLFLSLHSPPFSHFPALPCPSSTSAFPGVPPIHASQSPPFPSPHIPPLMLVCTSDAQWGTLLCQPRAHNPSFSSKVISLVFQYSALYPSVNI